MSLIVLGKTECSLCSGIIRAGDNIVSTSHFIAQQDDPLWRFSDSAMHRSCFLAWDQRAKFVEKFNRTVEAIIFGNGTYHRMEEDGSISVVESGV
jgi:hypothetical protein